MCAQPATFSAENITFFVLYCFLPGFGWLGGNMLQRHPALGGILRPRDPERHRKRYTRVGRRAHA